MLQRVTARDLGILTPVDRALAELLDFCELDEGVRYVLDELDWNREDLRTIYVNLVANGADQWASGHWVPASSIAFGQTLMYLANEEDEIDWLDKCARVVQYFARGETGPID